MAEWIVGRHGIVQKAEVVSISAHRDELGLVMTNWVPEMTYTICAKLRSGSDVCLVRDLRKGEIEEAMKFITSQIF